MNKKNIKNNKKINILLMLVIGIFTVIGSVVAYFTTTSTFENPFKTGIYQNKIVESFISPDNWTPGTTTEKTLNVSNTGSINMAVRARYTEKWVDSNGKELALKDSSGNVAAIVNLDSSWTKSEDGYYYFGSKDNKTILLPNATTTSFIKSVTFNGEIKSTLKETISPDKSTITYTSTGDGYDNATYTLTIIIDTIQYDQANSVWK